MLYPTETTALIAQPPFLTADLAGIGGRIKVEPEDFEVEEIPAYAPSGSGDFLYLWIEKRGLGGEYFLRQVARRLDVPVGEIGSAGIKDRHAVTRQWISVPLGAEERLAQLEGNGIRVLQVSRHTNKLRPGHLHGNRFRIVIRALEPQAPVDQIVAAWRERILALGLPNFYGPQRFGTGGETLQLGLALLLGNTDAQVKKKTRHPFVRKLALSAAQSALFNVYLARRMLDGLYRKVLPGDVMAKVPFGGMFVAEDVMREQARFDAGAIVSAGPIFGKKTFAAAGQAAAREQAILAEFKLQPDVFVGFGKLVQGTRRHNIVYVQDLSAAMDGATLRLSFTLPAGSYATMLVRELMKTAISADEDSSD